jgi:hypothetical protein
MTPKNELQFSFMSASLVSMAAILVRIRLCKGLTGAGSGFAAGLAGRKYWILVTVWVGHSSSWKQQKASESARPTVHREHLLFAAVVLVHSLFDEVCAGMAAA